MAEEQGGNKPIPKFAPRARQTDPQRRGFRTSLLFIGLECRGAPRATNIINTTDGSCYVEYFECVKH